MFVLYPSAVGLCLPHECCNDVTNTMSFFDQVARKLKLPKAKSVAHHEQKSGTLWHAFLLHPLIHLPCKPDCSFVLFLWLVCIYFIMKYYMHFCAT